MYTENTSIGELLELPQVMALLEKAAPQMVSGPAKGYLTPLTLAQLKVAQPESAQLADAILALANGADVDLTPLDPSKKKPILKGGSTVAQYDIDDVDGKMYMLNHAFSGCFILSFSKPIDEHIKGQVTYDGIPVKYILSTARIQAVLKIMCGAKSQHRSAGSFRIILRLNRLISIYELRSGYRNHHGYEEKAYQDKRQCFFHFYSSDCSYK